MKHVNRTTKETQKPIHLAYVLAEFPSSSEHFILDEILALEKRHIKITILCIKQRQLKIDIPELALLKASVIYATNSPTLFQALNLIRYVTKVFPRLKRKHFYYSQNILRQLRYLSLAINFERKLKNANVTHIHAHFAFIASDVARCLSVLMGVGYSMSVHAQDIYLNQRNFIHSHPQIKFILTCTKANRTYIQNVSLKIKVDHIYHGTDTNKWDYHGRFVSEKCINILTVGRLVEKKGYINSLKAIALLHRRGYAVQYTIVGDGPLKREIENLIVKHELTNIVTLLGTVNQNKIKDLMHKNDVFVLPCIETHNGDKDGLPNVLLESLSTGLPVVTSSISAIGELVKHKKTGIIINPYNERNIAQGILQLVRCPDLYKQISLNGRVLIEQSFNIKDSTDQLVELFSKTISS
jgi:colanic acid/amylovoran biosynthesis glycosyltransferase